jgi:hypothetical protein
MRTWLDSGVLVAVPDVTPSRVDLLSVADAKLALDLVRRRAEDWELLAAVKRILRDRAALVGSVEGFADLRAGRVVPLSDELLRELASIRR